MELYSNSCWQAQKLFPSFPSRLVLGYLRTTSWNTESLKLVKKVAWKLVPCNFQVTFPRALEKIKGPSEQLMDMHKIYISYSSNLQNQHSANNCIAWTKVATRDTNSEFTDTWDRLAFKRAPERGCLQTAWSTGTEMAGGWRGQRSNPP